MEWDLSLPLASFGALELLELFGALELGEEKKGHASIPLYYFQFSPFIQIFDVLIRKYLTDNLTLTVTFHSKEIFHTHRLTQKYLFRSSRK